MLILSRRIGEALLIDDDITIRILSVKGNQIRIGIEAPKSKTVLREELYVAQKSQGVNQPNRTTLSRK